MRILFYGPVCKFLSSRCHFLFSLRWRNKYLHYRVKFNIQDNTKHSDNWSKNKEGSLKLDLTNKFSP